MPVKKSQNHWELPELTNINRLPMSSCLIPYRDTETAIAGDRNASIWFSSLNGVWRFSRYDRPQAVPAEAMSSDFDETAAGFRDMPVPSNWTLQNTVDKPIYTNVQMPFANTPPVVPEENPTAVYRTELEIPAAWSGRRVVIHFGGVESYYEFSVNGEFVGMAKDTRLPSEFDITDYVEPGRNTLAVKVIRWSDSSYVEDQDQWWMAGIYREVYLYSTDPAFMRDVFVNADYDYRARVGRLSAQVAFSYVLSTEGNPWPVGGPPEPFRVAATLYDRHGAECWTDATRIDSSFRVSEYEIELCGDLPGVEPWSSENPALYHLVLTLQSHSGSPIETRCVRIGFRRVELGDRTLLINGKPVLIRGVNRHEHDDRLGKVMTRDRMLEDIRTLKQFNFNAVRTSHYPNTLEWYDLCDEYGIYLVDEADIEAHANYDSICRDPRWALAFEERMMRMVVRDKNHPAIIAWSAGNESGHGENHVTAISRVRAYDPSRVIHHEGEVKRNWTQGANAYIGGSNRSNDLINPMYPTIESIVRHATESRDPRPVILCEYSHAMGNSNGSLAEYWDAFERYPSLQGGFIWEWVDHGIVQTDDKGREYWAYGGDFGENIHDANFVADGLVWPDRKPHPAMFEFKKVAQPLGMNAVSTSEGRFLIRSKQDFTSLDWLEGEWKLEVEGELIESGKLGALEIPPHGEQEVSIHYTRPEALARPEAYVTFSFTTRNETKWCGPGHEVAWEQFRVNHLRLPVPSSRGEDDIRTSAGSHARTKLSVIDEDTLAFSYGEKQLISTGPSLNLFRATTDNDGIRGWAGQDAKPMGQWLAAGFHELQRTERSVSRNTDATGDFLSERTIYLGTDEGAPITFEQRIRFLNDNLARIDVRIEASSSLPTLPRVGIILETMPGFEALTWFGRGPQENHIDRKEGYPVGRYASSVSDQYVPYIMPQENGNKSEVRWFELADGHHRIRFTADPLFEFSAHHFRPEDLFACRHTNEVEDRLREQTVVSIDLRQRGVGTGSCGPQTREPYCIAAGSYEFGFFMEVLSAAS